MQEQEKFKINAMYVLLFGESYFEICSQWAEEISCCDIQFYFIAVIELKMDAPQMAKAVCNNRSLIGRSMWRP